MKRKFVLQLRENIITGVTCCVESDFTVRSDVSCSRTALQTWFKIGLNWFKLVLDALRRNTKSYLLQHFSYLLAISKTRLWHSINLLRLAVQKLYR